MRDAAETKSETQRAGAALRALAADLDQLSPDLDRATYFARRDALRAALLDAAREIEEAERAERRRRVRNCLRRVGLASAAEDARLVGLIERALANHAPHPSNILDGLERAAQTLRRLEAEGAGPSGRRAA